MVASPLSLESFSLSRFPCLTWRIASEPSGDHSDGLEIGAQLNSARRHDLRQRFPKQA